MAMGPHGSHAVRTAHHRLCSFAILFLHTNAAAVLLSLLVIGSRCPDRVPKASRIVVGRSLGVVFVALVAVVGGLITIEAACGREDSATQILPPLQLTLFFTMATLLAGNFLQLVISWELLGLSTCWLVGGTSPELRVRNGVRKAALIWRIGSCGLWLATALIWMTLGTLNIADVLATTIAPEQSFAITFAACGLFVACLAVCAQFPLFVWLPDCAEGPPSAAALLQTAGPGVAGIYLLIRCQPLFLHSLDLMFSVAILGGFTALIAGFMALSQTNPRRLLAFLTFGQYGLMFLALGTGSQQGLLAAALCFAVHLFGKSLLCLGGNPATQQTSAVKSALTIGLLGLSGIPPLSGFWSMTAILATVQARSVETADSVSVVWWQILFWSAAVAICLASIGLVRAYRLLLNNSSATQASPAPSPVTFVQKLVLALLGIATLGLGAILSTPTGWLSQFLAPLVPQNSPQAPNDLFVYIVCTAAAGGGILIGWYAPQLGRSLPEWLVRSFRPLAALSRRELYLNDYYFLGVALPLRAASMLSRFVDWFIIDRLIVGMTIQIPLKFAKSARPLQNGLIQFYALVIVLALAMILAVALWSGIFSL